MANKETEPTNPDVKEAGKGSLDDEMLPNKGEPVEQETSGGDEYDTAGEHGDMAVGTAKNLDEKAREGEKGR